MSPSDLNNGIREIMASVRTQHENKGWADLGHTVTYLSGTTFKIATDVTAQYSVNRRIRCTDSGTLYGRISASSYGAPDTTVTVVLDSGSLSVALSAVALGPEANVFPTVLTGDLTVSGAFTSLGIDDNATGERIQIADTGTLVGTAGADYTIAHVATDRLLVISGGVDSSNGGAGLFYGDTHASRANDFRLTAGGNLVLEWDESAGDIQISTGVGAKTVALTIDASQDAAFAGEVIGTGFTGTLDGILGGGTPAAASVTTLAASSTVSGSEIQVAGTNIFETIYPVGSVYINKSVATNPGTLFGVGTWVAIEDAFLIGASSTYAAESTGGSKDAAVVTHTHTIAHTHTFPVYGDSHASAVQARSGSGGLSGNEVTSASSAANSGIAGSSGTDANLPPYVAVYMWERTA